MFDKKAWQAWCAVVSVCVVLTSCKADDKVVQPFVFEGCYSVDKALPAQIYISKQGDGVVMQMKEPDGTWDTPEPMKAMTVDRAWDFFSANALGLSRQDLQQALARHDDVMVLGQADKALLTVKPELDSPYVVSLFGSVTTIYQVACDNEPLVLDVDLAGIHSK